jgi:type III restriction enzyme
MVGRGLRLPYGERTGDKDVDSVMLTAHDKFSDIISEAQKGDSIFKAGNVIKVEEIEPEQITYAQLSLEVEPDKQLEEAYEQTKIEKTEKTDELLKKAAEIINDEVSRHIQHTPTHTVTPVQAKQIVEDAKTKAMEERQEIDALIETEKEKLIDAKIELAMLKDKAKDLIAKFTDDITKLQ